MASAPEEAMLIERGTAAADPAPRIGVPGVPGAFLPPSASVADLSQGVHACLLYEDGSDPVSLVAPYLKSGLDAGECAVYVLGEHDAGQVRISLAAAGIDVTDAERRGALALVNRWDVTFPNGEFDPAAMLRYVRQTITATLAAGFRGVRLAAEMTWALRMGVGHDRLIHYEADGNHLYPHEPLVAVCLYNRSRFPAAVCQEALRTHPVVVLDGQVYPNIYYEPPGAVTGEGPSAAERVEWMLRQLRGARDAEAQRAALVREQAARELAEHALRERERFIATASHELRTPLTSLRGYAQLARRQLDRGTLTGDDLRGALDAIGQQTVRMDRLVAQMLDLSRLQAGKLRLEREDTDLAALAARVATGVRMRSPKHLVRVTHGGRDTAAEPRAPLRASVDPMRVEQVLDNLLDNAVKFSLPGSEVVLDVSVEGDGTVAASVSDKGAGIEADCLPRLFDPFYQAHDGAGGGMGLGLYLCKEIVELHGGAISAACPPCGGTTVSFTLPPASPALRHTQATADLLSVSAG